MNEDHRRKVAATLRVASAPHAEREGYYGEKATA
jgi:hypothetical protein